MDMKIHQLIGAGLLLTMLLTACAPVGDETPVTSLTTEETTVETQATTTVQTTDNNLPIATPVGGIGEKSEQYSITKGNKTLMNISLSLPVASTTGDQSLQETLTARLDLIEAEIRSTIDGLSQKYEADITAGREGLATPSFGVRFELNYFTSEAASLTYFYSETTSDGLSIAYTRFCNIDLRVGSEILLSALIGEGKADLLTAKLKEAVASSGIDGLYEGQDDLITDLMNSRWYLTRNSIAFRFSPGDLAPVSSGEITVSLDKAALAELLSSYGSALIE